MSKLTSALTELKQAKAIGLPSESTVNGAKPGNSWKGKKKDGTPWGLTKNGAESYTCSC